MSNKVLAKTMVYSKGAAIAISAVIVCGLLVAMAFFIRWVYMSYQEALDAYDDMMYLYINGYSSTKPEYPKSPIGYYFLIILPILAACVIAVICVFKIREAQMDSVKDAIIYDEKKNTLKFLSSDGGYAVVNISDIKYIWPLNYHTGVFNGKVYMPVTFRTTKLSVSYKSGSKTMTFNTCELSHRYDALYELRRLIDKSNSIFSK